MTDMYVMPEVEFEETEDAVLQTPRGRAFLRRYSSRERAVAIDEIRATIAPFNEVATDGITDSAHLDILRHEIQQMSAAILHCREEIASIKPENGGDNRIMAATEELDAIVTSTERATTEILSAAEVIQDTADKLAEGGASADFCDQVVTQAISIMTACSFQDITGQRITKVVHALSYLEQRLNSMMDIWDGNKNTEKAAAAPADLEDKRPDSHLLNGPQLEGEGVSQGDVDALFDGPDPTGEAADTSISEDQDNEATQGTGEPAEAESQAEDVAAASSPADDIEIELAPEDVPAIETAAPEMETAAPETATPETAATEDDSPPPAEENVVIAEAPLGQDEVAKLLGG